jgi:hypothetical protein
MRKKIRAAHAAAWLLGGATLAISGRAAADVCSNLTNPVYVSGSSAFKPVLGAVQNVLGSAVTIVYQSPGSCEGLDFVLNGTLDTDTPVYFIPGATGTVTTGSCTLPAAGATIDIGFSDVYAATCTATFDPNLPAVGTGTADFLGPIQAMTFAVPVDSSENIISAEAAYMVFGFDAASGMTITPWTDPNQILVRFWDSGTLEMIGKAINLPGGKWKNATTKTGVQFETNTAAMQGALNTAEMTASKQSTTIGILSTSGLVTGVSKGLAFQGVGQSCSYYPDSTSSKFDKINVRQGRYEIWGPEHMVTNVDGSGKPVGKNSNTVAVQTLINALLSTSQALPAQSDAGTPEGGVTTLGEAEVGQIIKAISAPTAGFIPQCAMQVSRTSEIGPEASYVPPAACSCAYETATGTPLSGHTCNACTTNADCTATPSTPTCHFSFCEAGQ